MPWVKLTDDWYDDPALSEASPLAVTMWVLAISWCARNLTDGHISRSQVRKLIDLDHESLAGASLRADDIADELVRLGKWTASDRGFTIRNYHRYQPKREKVLADRAADAERKRTRKTTKDTPPDPGGIPADSPPEPPRTPRRPVPVPDSDPVPSSSLATHEPPGPRPDDDPRSTGRAHIERIQRISAVPADVWHEYAELRYQREPAGSVRSPTPWKRRTAANARVELGESAARWWDQFELTPRRLAECLIDGRAPRNVPRRMRPQESTMPNASAL